jgi:3-deoxy-7-phosphoheptulonate synthase
VVTEVVAAEDIELVAEYADVLQIGARNMQNYRLLEAVGKSHRPVLLKRGPSATIDELLLAAEYILDGGNQQVMLCERGIRTFEAHTRFTLPLATVPYLHAKTHLPVVVDPSHGTGHTPLVAAMARAAIAAGADGLIVEVHPNPEKALSDGYQSLTFPQFEEMMAGCRRVAEAMEMRMGD